MGRPVKSSRFGSSAGDFEVTGAFSTESIQPDGSGAEAVSTASGNFIVSQRSSTRFKVNCLQIILDDSTVAYAAKIFNRTVHYKTAGGTTGSVKYSLSAEGTDEDKVSGIGSIDTI